jgi:PadR family transcriptional regulator, regulatory protein PadR
MRGLLTFLVLWIISRGPVTGADVSREIETRRGRCPSPGTIYPALKDLREKGLVAQDEAGRYSLTASGKDELAQARELFSTIFYDRDEICKGKECKMVVKAKDVARK